MQLDETNSNSEAYAYVSQNAVTFQNKKKEEE